MLPDEFYCIEIPVDGWPAGVHAEERWRALEAAFAAALVCCEWGEMTGVAWGQTSAYFYFWFQDAGEGLAFLQGRLRGAQVPEQTVIHFGEYTADGQNFRDHASVPVNASAS